MILNSNELQIRNGVSSKVILLSIFGQVLFYLILTWNDQMMMANILTIFFGIFLLQGAGFKTATTLNLKTFLIKIEKYFLGIPVNTRAIQLHNDSALKVKTQSITDSGNIYQIYVPDRHKERIIFETSNNTDMDRTLKFLSEHNINFEDQRP